ncbi:MAG TPA: hypothetical protein DIT48_01355 [Actinobacteria bacterium]|jgi:hypothetical protein|nr:hypothetical protein [Actinomycetota bacterium]HCP62185.1 hypothetical protein [Actinomycetota bacterium]
MVRTGVRGKIESGAEQGRLVLVQDDMDQTGGFLILTGADRDLSIGGADYWVEGLEALERFAEESNWVIQWEHDGSKR